MNAPQKQIENESCLTIRELKEWLNTLEEVDEFGDEREVWMMTGHGISSPVVRAVALNMRGSSFDVLLETA